MSPSKTFEGVLRQWGIDTTDLSKDPTLVAHRVKAVEGGGVLQFDNGDGDAVSTRCKSMFAASNHVLQALAVMSVEALLHNDKRLAEALHPSMFQWIPDAKDVTSTAEADAVIAKVKESMQ